MIQDWHKPRLFISETFAFRSEKKTIHMAQSPKKTVAKKAVVKAATKEVAPAKETPVKKVATKKTAAKKAVSTVASTPKAVVTPPVVEKAAVKKVATKKVATKKAPAKKASTPALTTICGKIDVGFGNALYLRGSGGGLSWDKGVLMGNASSDEWLWSAEASAGTIECKFLINDEIWSEGDNCTVSAGERLETTPSF